MKHHKPWFDEKCLGFLDLKKQTKIQWLHGPDQGNVDNLNNARHEASRHFRNKRKEYLNAKTKQLETNCKIKILGTCIGASLTLRRATSLKIIH